jgi:hypothetical protein
VLPSVTQDTKNLVAGRSKQAVAHVAGPGEAACAKTGDLRTLSGAPRHARCHRPRIPRHLCCDSKQWGHCVVASSRFSVGCIKELC